MNNDNFDHVYQTAYPDTYKKTKEFCRENRNYQTFSELLLWDILRNKKLGYKFRRQHIIGDYIAAFICLEKHLIIEVDGGYHNLKLQEEEDLIRSQWLYKQGFYVLRFTNDMVCNNIYEVKERISEILTKLQ